MLTQEKVTKILKKENVHLRRKYGIKRIGLFGSLVKGKQRKDSDVDIFVEFKKPIGLKFIEFAEYMERLLRKKVDIITPEGLKGIRIEKIAKDIEKSLQYV